MDNPRRTPGAVLARMSWSATVFYAFVLYVAFAFIQPELNPLHRFGSEYAVGRMGWLMKLAFFVWGGGLVALGLAMAKGLDAAARSNTAIVLFLIGGIGVFLAGVFDADMQIPNPEPPPAWIEAPPSPEQRLHGAAGSLGLLSLMAAAGLASRRLRIAGRLGFRYRSLRALAWLTPVAFVAFIVSVPFGLAGLGQRIFLAVLFAWQLLAAWGISVGAFRR